MRLWVISIGCLLFAGMASAQINLVSATLPGARTVEVGQVATLFATVINPSDTDLTACEVGIDVNYSGRPDVTLSYQRTDAQNQPVGGVDTLFDLAGGASQTLVVSLTAQSVLIDQELGLVSTCNGGRSRVISDVNTVRLNAVAGRADLIPIAVTPSGDGVLRIEQAGGANAFSVAVMNIGAAETITARVDFGRYHWPMDVSLCATNAATGECLASPGEQQSLQLDTNGIATFSVFAISDARLEVPFLPDIARIVVSFETSEGQRLAATSVAIISPEGGGYRALDIEAAGNVALAQGARAVLIQRNGETLFEAYQGSGGVNVVEVLNSGTKSFSCLTQALAIDRGLFNPDDLAWSGISEWAPESGEPWALIKQDIRGRDLISLAHGLPQGSYRGNVSGVDSYRDAFDTVPVYRADQHAIYGNTGFQAFAALFELRTGGVIEADGVVRGGMDPAMLVDEAIAEPLGIEINWNRDINGKPNFSASAAMTARDWARLGQFFLDDGVWQGQSLLSQSSIRRCMHYQTDAYRGYGLSFWLNRDVGDSYQSNRDSLPPEALRHMPTTGRMMPSAPEDLFMAWGANNMRMHMLPSEDLVIVTFGGEGDPDLFYQALFGN